MKIATMATGGIGGYLAVKLTESGHQVATIARGDHLKAIASIGLTLRSPDGDTTIAPWIATDDPREVGPVDAVIIGVKGDQLESAAQGTFPLLGSDTIVVPFLNGVEAADRLTNVLPPQSVANGVAFVSTTISEPGVITQTGAFSRFIVGERDNHPSERVTALRQALTGAGIDAPETDDIEREVWSKFILFAAVSGVTTATRCTMQDVFEYPELQSVFQGVVGEVAALARARGVSVSTTAEEETWSFAQTLPGPMRASTAIDLELGKPLETHWINGTVGRLGKEAGVETPVNATIAGLLQPYLNGKP